MKFENVKICTMWLASEDYPALLGKFFVLLVINHYFHVFLIWMGWATICHIISWLCLTNFITTLCTISRINQMN